MVLRKQQEENTAENKIKFYRSWCADKSTAELYETTTTIASGEPATKKIKLDPIYDCFRQKFKQDNFFREVIKNFATAKVMHYAPYKLQCVTRHLGFGFLRQQCVLQDMTKSFTHSEAYLLEVSMPLTG